MEAAVFLYYAIGIGFLILVGFISYMMYTLAGALKELTSILVKVDDIAKDANELKNIIKGGMFYLKKFVFRRGGEDKDDK